MRFFTTLTISLFLLAVPLRAVVNSGNPGGNTSAPTGEDGQPTDPGFKYVGEVSYSSGVYLGNGWVMTAKHISPGTFKFNGKKYQWDTAPAVVMPGADMQLFRLLEWPDLPPLKITELPPRPDQLLVMIGYGRHSADELSYWKIDQKTEPWTWTEVPSTDLPDVAGVLAPGKIKKAWGTNRIIGVSKHPQLGSFFMTQFDGDPLQRTTYEAQAVSNDSGGAVFVQNKDGWALAGIMSTVHRIFPGQPGIKQQPRIIGSAVFGNQTIVIDASAYRDIIIETTGIPK